MSDALELVHVPAAAGTAGAVRPPVLLVHGAFAAAWCWEATQAALAAAGWESFALSLSGHGASPGREQLHQFTLCDYLQDIDWALERIGRVPILVGHSLGGYLLQRIAERMPVPGLALLASVPPYGLAGSLTYMGTCYPGLLMELQRFAAGAMPEPDLRFVRELLFAPDTDEAHLGEFASRVQPESIQALSQLWMPQPWRLLPRVHDCPVLVMGAGSDRILPFSDIWLTAQAWGTRPVMIPEAGHALMCNTHFPEVMRQLLDWLQALPVARGNNKEQER
ncbi:alpha/beta hydrolase [Chitinilyticum litopenaei]|uniref:alpha/beta hydrolase n=1 Tax=Chitinilyticum litopenaei TaxID=1121276 RepID=UPI0003FE825B|nr:alpha/beta fold hydrolase [Chitinilyticum litopenaei]